MLNLTKIYGFTQFLTQTYNESSSSDYLRTELVQPKFMIGTLHLDNHRQSFLAVYRLLDAMCPGLPESSSQLAHILASQCLKFTYDTPSFVVLSTLNNLQDLGPEYLEATFPVK